MSKITRALSEILSVLESINHQLGSNGSRGRAVTKCDLDHLENNIMSAISDFAAKQNAHNDRVDAAIAGVTADVQAMKDLIDKLQNSPGSITPEDQASLDALDARAEATAAKLEALDALTPPTPPPTV